jgi:hypothetical protein
MSRIPHFLDNRLTDGGEVVSVGYSTFTPRKIPGTQFCYKLSQPQGLNTAEEIKKKKLHGLSPRANYTDRATAASRRSVANLCG